MVPPSKMLFIKNPRLFALLFASTLAGCTPPGPRALLDGKRSIDRGKYTQAIEQLKLATSVLSTNAQAWNYLGLAYHYAGRAADAEAAYGRALACNHDLMEARYNLGCLLLAEGKFDGARTHLTAYNLRRGNSADGCLKLGASQLGLADLTGAERSFNEALRVGAPRPEAWNGLGLVHARRGRAADAVQDFNRALKLRANYPAALLNLAIVTQRDLKDQPTALRHYRDYLALKPPPENLEAVGAVAHQLEQEINPPPRPNPGTNNGSSVPATNSLRSMPPSRGKEGVLPPPKAALAPEISTNLARPQVRAASVTNSELPKPRNDLATKPVQDAATKAPSPAPPRPAGPSSPPGQLALNSVQPASAPRVSPPKPVQAEAPPVAPGRYPYRLLSTPDPGDHAAAERSFNAGVVAQQNHRPVEAISAYRKATELDPAYFEAYYNLGLATAEGGNLPAALRAFESALAIRPESLEARFQFAQTLRQANFITDAVNEFEKLAVQFPNDPRPHLALGNLYANQLRQPAQARQHYLKAIETDPRNPQADAVRYWLAANPP